MHIPERRGEQRHLKSTPAVQYSDTCLPAIILALGFRARTLQRMCAQHSGTRPFLILNVSLNIQQGKQSTSWRKELNLPRYCFYTTAI